MSDAHSDIILAPGAVDSAMPRSGWATVSRPFKALVWGLFAVGVVARLAPFLDVGNRLVEQFVTEDGYFMLAIARNLAIGNGFSIADGEVPTNGTQPLTTLLFTIGFVLADGAKRAGIAYAQFFQFVAAIAAAWLLYRLGLKALARRPDAHRIAALAAATWFASPIALPHSMNGLETGIYALVAIIVAHRFVETDAQAERIWSLGDCLLTGLLLGIAFWTRNDAAFLILAACLTYVYTGLHKGMSVASARFGRAIIFGLTSIVVASPWLGFNYSLFGHIVPVSGRAESLTAGLFHNTLEVPPVLLEYLGVFVPIPQTLEESNPIAVACAIPLVAGVLALPRLWRVSHATERRLLLLVLIYGGCLSAFYGLYFGAGWFMARYLFPLSPFLALLWAVWVWQWLMPRLRGPLPLVAATLMVLMVVTQNVRWYQGGDRHPHFQVIDWAESNIPKSMWVGAIQTGTLGYFHDRTVNLDGKVNIDAYHAVKSRRAGPYIPSTDIEYLLDWPGVADSITKPAVADEFRIIVLDEEEELSVLQRKDRIRLGPDHRFDLEAARIARRQLETALAQLEPSDYAERWRLVYMLGWLEDGLEDGPASERRAREAIKLSVESQDERSEWRQREVMSRRLLANVLRVRHDFKAALAEQQKAVALLKTQASTSMTTQRDLALSRLELGELHWELGQIDAAQSEFQTATDAFKALDEAGVEGTDRDRAVALLSRGDTAVHHGRLDEAQKLFGASLAIRKRRYEAQKDRQSAFDYALAQARMGRLAHLQGHFERAVTLINNSIALRRSLPKLNPGQAEPTPSRALRFAEAVLGRTSVTETKSEAP